MATLAERVLEALQAVPPPTGPAEIASKLGVQSSNVRTRISQLLADGVLKPNDIPWRGQLTSATGKGYRKRTSRDIAKRAEQIADEQGNDRVAALRLLHDIRTTSSDSFGPPSPDDREGIIKALSVQMAAAGREVSMEALAVAFPERDTIDTEAENGTKDTPAPETEGDGLPASGDSLA
jgi:hypothetical protein